MHARLAANVSLEKKGGKKKKNCALGETFNYDFTSHRTKRCGDKMIRQSGETCHRDRYEKSVKRRRSAAALIPWNVALAEQRTFQEFPLKCTVS